MTQTEWIVSLDDDLKDYEELFVGNVRDGDKLIRCKDCKHTEYEDDGEIICTFWDFCDCNHHVLKNGFCDRAERKEE